MKYHVIDSGIFDESGHEIARFWHGKNSRESKETTALLAKNVANFMNECENLRQQTKEQK